MTIRNRKAWGWGTLLSCGFALLYPLLLATPALATKAALVNILANRKGAHLGSYATISNPSGFAAVGSTPGTPSVRVIRGVVTSYGTTYYSGPLTPYGTRFRSIYNKSGHFLKSNPLGPTAMVIIDPPNTTGLPTCTGNCHPRFGQIQMNPGANRFGGTLRFINKGYNRAMWVASVGYYYGAFGPNATPMMTGPMFPGNYGRQGSGFVEHTSLVTPGGSPVRYDSIYSTTEGPFTTGVIKVHQPAGYYVTNYTTTGTDMRTPSGLYGTLSLVRPALIQVFYLDGPGGSVIAGGLRFGYRQLVRMTFLPEPDEVLMLGCGLLTMAGLLWYRKR
jgi:hypothetical protein